MANSGCAEPLSSCLYRGIMFMEMAWNHATTVASEMSERTVGSGTEMHLGSCCSVAIGGIVFAVIDVDEVYVDSTTRILIGQCVLSAQDIVVDAVAGTL